MKKNLHHVDVHVGGRIRLRRTLLGITQTNLANDIGISFQQIQKYELGSNRVSSSRLYQLSKALEVPISFFFDDMKDGHYIDDGSQEIKHRESLEMMRRYQNLDPDSKKIAFNFIKKLALLAEGSKENA